MYVHGKCQVLKIIQWLCVCGWECVYMRVHTHTFTRFAQNRIQNLRHRRNAHYTELHSQLYLIEMDNYTQILEPMTALIKWQYVAIYDLMHAYGKFISWLFHYQERIMSCLQHEKASGLLKKKLETNQFSFLQCISRQWNALDHYHSEYNVKEKLQHVLVKWHLHYLK